jgi:hypothetical protein
MVAAASSSIKYPWFQLHLIGDVENLVGVVCFSKIFSGWGSSDHLGVSSSVIPSSLSL